MVDVAYKHLGAFKMSFMSPNKSFSRSALSALPCTCSRDMQEGKARKSRKARTFMEAAAEARKGKHSYCARHCPYPEFLL